MFFCIFRWESLNINFTARCCLLLHVVSGMIYTSMDCIIVLMANWKKPFANKVVLASIGGIIFVDKLTTNAMLLKVLYACSQWKEK